MEEGFAAQLLGMGTQLRGGDAAGEGLPLGALSGLLADMLPTGEALQSLGRASSYNPRPHLVLAGQEQDQDQDQP